MLDYLRSHLQLYLVILFWIGATLYGGPLIYALLPLSVFLLRGRDMYPEILFGFLMILILSDMDPAFVAMRKIKTAKHAMMVAISLVFLMDRARFAPLAGVFPLFLPFFAYSVLPLANGSDPINGVQKTLSYALLYLVVPNYVLYGFRKLGWDFIRNFIYFIVSIITISYLAGYAGFIGGSIAGRFRGPFGNPNGLGIFMFLTFMFVATANYLKKDLFPAFQRYLIYGIVLFFLYKCGSRTSLVATLMFLVFSRFFAFSPFIGFVGFIVALVVAEAVSSNLPAIVMALSLEKYFRVETLDDGSGRYFAWRFAWEQINQGGFFLFGGGFGNDEWVMRHNYPYLRSQGHHGGVHNSYLTMWFNTGIIGIILYLRGFFLMFFKANKRAPIAFAIMFATMFSVLYESWLTGSLNPFTIILISIMTLVTEDEIVNWRDYQDLGEEEVGAEPAPEATPLLRLPAR
ncbi:MAG: O-antigen ligase family protein [Flavobacteriales bacterium]|nr:O-antigen ligase family protein [Flavobacteriales bacterium]